MYGDDLHPDTWYLIGSCRPFIHNDSVYILNEFDDFDSKLDDSVRVLKFDSLLNLKVVCTFGVKRQLKTPRQFQKWITPILAKSISETEIGDWFIHQMDDRWFGTETPNGDSIDYDYYQASVGYMRSHIRMNWSHNGQVVWHLQQARSIDTITIDKTLFAVASSIDFDTAFHEGFRLIAWDINKRSIHLDTLLQIDRNITMKSNDYLLKSD